MKNLEVNEFSFNVLEFLWKIQKGWGGICLGKIGGDIPSHFNKIDQNRPTNSIKNP